MQTNSLANRKSHHHAYHNLNYHLVLVVKYRKKAITSSMLKRLHELVNESCEQWNCTLIEFNGEEDHIHILFRAHPSMDLSKFINNLKTITSRKIRKEYSEHLLSLFFKPVFWSRAYCLISTGGATIEIIKKYIENQNPLSSPTK